MRPGAGPGPSNIVALASIPGRRGSRGPRCGPRPRTRSAPDRPVDWKLFDRVGR